MDSNKEESSKTKFHSRQRTKPLLEAFEENRENWPTRSLKKALMKLKPDEGAEVFLELNPCDHDITEEALDLERKFRPIITLRTTELKTELSRWKIGGGSFFRVIANQAKLEDASKIALQYLILWTRQLFPFQFFFLSIPFFLTTLFLWQFSAEYIAQQGVGWNKYAALLISGLLFIIIGFWTYFEGLYRRYIQGRKKWKVIPDSMIGFVIPGILLWTTALEYAITDLANAVGFIAIIPISAWTSLLLGVIILGIGLEFYLRGEKSFVENFSHPMDYAPLIIFLERDRNEKWTIDGAQFDYFHYRTAFSPKKNLTFHESDKGQENPWFLIDRSWHALREYIKPGLLLRVFSNAIFNITLWIFILAYYIVMILTQYTNVDLGIVSTVTIEAQFLFFSKFLSFIILPMIIVLMIWAHNRTREYKLDIWDELQNKTKDEILQYHYITQDKLRIWWNLRDKEHLGEQRITNLWAKESTWIEGDKSRLVARVKLQYPFDRYKDWKTLRDTEEELLSLISLQQKQREFFEVQNEIEKAKVKLFKYRRPFTKGKFRERMEKLATEEQLDETD